MIRAFIAVELDEPLQRQIARVQQQLRSAVEQSAAVARVAWVRPASMHLTLKFLGDIDDSIVSPLQEAIAGAARDWRSIEIPLTRLGGFPRIQEPRILWLGPGDQWEQHDDAFRLRVIARAIDEAAATHKVARDTRPFSPHLTLGRVKTGERHIGRALASASAITPTPGLPPLTVSAVALMKSLLDSTGAVHTRVWRVTLSPLS